MRPARFVLLALTGLMVTTAAASADRGVALDLGRLDVAQKLTPGAGYYLPSLGVRNPGDEVTSYRIVVSFVQGQQGKPIPKDWVRVKPAELTLKPGRTEKVRARLDLPTGADPGDYEGLLAAQIVTKGKGAQMGAAAAAKLTFSVESATLLGAWWYQVRTFLSDHDPWTWLVPAILLTAMLAWQLRRRFAFQVVRRA
jgi:hypothetical protein